MSVSAAHRLRWTIGWVAVAVWFMGLAINFGGNALHLLLLLAIIALVYELLAEDRVPS
ncbi:MAG: hypothetical protein HY071_05035 [Chloroflexi bacterium]|nr:hypothetical protein [Chloroflexota bacterium]